MQMFDHIFKPSRRDRGEVRERLGTDFLSVFIMNYNWVWKIVNAYRKLQLVSPGLIQLRNGFRVGL